VSVTLLQMKTKYKILIIIGIFFIGYILFHLWNQPKVTMEMLEPICVMGCS